MVFIVTNHALEQRSKKKEKKYFQLYRFQRPHVNDTDLLVSFTIHATKLSRFTLLRYLLEVELISKRTAQKGNSTEKVSMVELKVKHCDKKSPSIYLCWYLVDASKLVKAKTVKKLKNYKINLISIGLNKLKTRAFFSDLTQRKELSLRDLHFKSLDLLIYSQHSNKFGKSLNEDELPKRARGIEGGRLEEVVMRRGPPLMQTTKQAGEVTRLKKRAFLLKRASRYQKRDKW